MVLLALVLPEVRSYWWFYGIAACFVSYLLYIFLRPPRDLRRAKSAPPAAPDPAGAKPDHDAPRLTKQDWEL